MSTNQKTKPAVQLVLGSQAIEFPLTVTVPKLDGTESVLTFTCRAMRKTQWAKVRDDHHAAVLQSIKDRAAAAATEPAKTAEAAPRIEDGLQAMVSQGLKTDADLVLQFAVDWDLNDPLETVTLQDLEDEFGGTLNKVINGYEAAVYQGRLGN